MLVYYNKLDQLIIRIIFFLFKINPKIPIKNKNNDRFIVLYFCINPLGTVNERGAVLAPGSSQKGPSRRAPGPPSGAGGVHLAVPAAN